MQQQTQSETCSCPAAGWCERRQKRVPNMHWQKCQAGMVANLDDLYSQPVNPQILKPAQPAPPVGPQISTIGTQILSALESKIGSKISCGTCRQYILGLNRQAVHNHEVIVEELFRTGLPIGGIVRGAERTRAWISEAIASVIPKPDPVISAIPSDTTATQFVWPYWHGGANGDEIRWSVRSVETFFQGPSRFLIVGDRPPWYSGEMIHVPRISQAGEAKTFRPGLRDMLAKMHVIASSPQVADEFVWMMDDVYFVKAVTLDDLRTPRGTGWREDASNAWQRVKTDTMRRLAADGLSQYDFATHLPHVVEKSKLQAVLTDYQLSRADMLWENLYGNRYRDTPGPVGPFLTRIQTRKPVTHIRQQIKTATILNNDVGAWSKELRQVLSELLPRPASTETGKLSDVPHIMIIQASYSDPELSRRRLEIARHTSIPSLAYQTRRPVVHIATNPADPHCAERIELYRSTGCEVKVLDRPEWKLYGENWELPEGRKIVSRMDDDDVICKEFCEATYNAAPDAGECALIWPNGYVFWREMIFALTHPGIQFVTLATDRMTDPHQEQHWGYHKTWSSKVVSHNVGWIWVRHGDAATSTLPRYRKHHKRGIDAKRIPINLRAIVRAIEASGTASGNYTEHNQMRSVLGHVLQENAAHAR